VLVLADLSSFIFVRVFRTLFCMSKPTSDAFVATLGTLDSLDRSVSQLDVSLGDRGWSGRLRFNYDVTLEDRGHQN
jgi:hypothetical protein